MKYSKGIMWLDDCRIPFVDEGDKDKNTNGLSRFNEYRGKRQELGYGFNGGETYNINTQGRFTPNLLVCDDMLNDGSISKTLKSSGANRTKQQTIYGGGKGFPTWNEGHNGDKGSNSRYYDLDKWFDKMLYEV